MCRAGLREYPAFFEQGAMNATIHHILQELESGLLVSSIDEAVIVVRDSIEQLQGYMRLYTFRGAMEEILYFKVFKPRFIAHRIYAESALKQARLYPWVEHTLEQQEFYEYYTSDHSHRDHRYFTQRTCQKLNFNPDDSLANTGQGYDMWVARILAGEWRRIR